MNQEKLMDLSLKNLGLDYTIAVPVNMFFQLFEILPGMIEDMGLEEAKRQYAEMVSEVRAYAAGKSHTSWIDADNDDVCAHLRQCQVVVALSAVLLDMPLFMSGDGLQETMEDLGGINVTKQVEAGMIPKGLFEGSC